MLFLLFDVEMVFLIPWAVVYKGSLEAGLLFAGEMAVFVGVLFLGLIIAWRKGGLEWE